jgi:hypothetical protein
MVHGLVEQFDEALVSQIAGHADLVLTSPWRPGVDAWRRALEVFAIADRVLRDGGWLAVATPARVLPELFAAYNDIGWSGSVCEIVLAYSPSPIRRKARPRSAHMSVICMSKGAPAEGSNIIDVADVIAVERPGASGGKIGHDAAAIIISQFSRADGLVVDPFAEGQAIALAAEQTGRRFIGRRCDR